MVMVKGSDDAGSVDASECRCGKRAESGGRGGDSARYDMIMVWEISKGPK